MQIRVKLMGIFREKAPEGNVLELPDGATIRDALETLGIPREDVHLTMVNDVHQRDESKPLNDGDELLVLPPIGGG